MEPKTIKCFKLNMPGADVRYYQGFLENHKVIYETLEQLPWQKRTAEYGQAKTYKLNRMTYAFGDPDTHAPKIWGAGITVEPWTLEVLDIKNKIEKLTGFKFNICLGNYYQNGKQTIGMHADKEERGSTECIASISLGSARHFKFQKNETLEEQSLILEPGSLLIMGHGTQENYRHMVPVEPDNNEGRINLTFRWFDAERYSII